MPPDGDFGELHAAPLSDGVIPQLVERLWRLNQTVAPESMIFNQSFMLTIASLLMSSHCPMRRTQPVGGLSGWQLRRTVEILRARSDGKVSLEELAREARLSPFHFARAFKQSTGLPPYRYHISLKLEAARRLLQETDLSVAEVAERLGLSGPRAFARVFRREIGMTPAQYRLRSR